MFFIPLVTSVTILLYKSFSKMPLPNVLIYYFSKPYNYLYQGSSKHDTFKSTATATAAHHEYFEFGKMNKAPASCHVEPTLEQVYKKQRNAEINGKNNVQPSVRTDSSKGSSINMTPVVMIGATNVNADKPAASMYSTLPEETFNDDGDFVMVPPDKPLRTIKGDFVLLPKKLTQVLSPGIRKCWFCRTIWPISCTQTYKKTFFLHNLDREVFYKYTQKLCRYRI